MDLLHPEVNGELKVHPFVNVEQNGVLHNGIALKIKCDPRDYIAGKCKAHLQPSMNEILVEIPSMSHDELHEFEKINAMKKALGIHCPRLEEAENVARNEILASPDRQKKCFLLRVPDEMILSNKHYSPESQENEIENDIVFIETGWDVPLSNPPKNYPMLAAWVLWKVSIVEVQPRIVKNESSANPQAAKLAKRLSGMNVAP
jgi:hypothetical protein